MEVSTRQAVQQYYQAWQSGKSEQFPLADGLIFDGPVLSLSNASEFRKMANQFSPLVKKVELLEEVYEGNKAFVMLEFSTNVPEVGNWIAMDYFVVEGGKIKYGRTVYDPRKLVAFMESQTR